MLTLLILPGGDIWHQAGQGYFCSDNDGPLLAPGGAFIAILHACVIDRVSRNAQDGRADNILMMTLNFFPYSTVLLRPF